MLSTTYPASSTAFFRALSATSALNMITAVPASALAEASSTPGIASRDVFTIFSQWPHIMPSIFMFFSTDAALASSLCAALIFLSLLASRILNRFRRRALETTHTLLRLMAAAPNMGVRVRPSGINTPAAMGMPMEL